LFDGKRRERIAGTPDANERVEYGFLRRVHGREEIVVTGAPELLQSERGSAEERAEQQPEHLQEDVAAPENGHAEKRRHSIVQYHAIYIHFAKVIEDRFALSRNLRIFYCPVDRSRATSRIFS